MEQLATELRQLVMDLSGNLEKLFTRYRDGKVGADVQSITIHLFARWCVESGTPPLPRIVGEINSRQRANTASASELSRFFINIGFPTSVAAEVADAVAAALMRGEPTESKIEPLCWPLYEHAVKKLCVQTAHVLVAHALLPHRGGRRVSPYERAAPPWRRRSRRARNRSAFRSRQRAYSSGFARSRSFSAGPLRSRGVRLVDDSGRQAIGDEPGGARRSRRSTGNLIWPSSDAFGALIGFTLPTWTSTFGETSTNTTFRGKRGSGLAASTRPRSLLNSSLTESVTMPKTLAWRPRLSLTRRAAAAPSSLRSFPGCSRTSPSLDRPICQPAGNRPGFAPNRRLTEIQRCIHAVDIHPFAAFLSTLNVLFLVLPRYREVRLKNPHFAFEPAIMAHDSLFLTAEEVKLAGILQEHLNGRDSGRAKTRNGTPNC